MRQRQGQEAARRALSQDPGSRIQHQESGIGGGETHKIMGVFNVLLRLATEEQQNSTRSKQVLSLQYDSPFRIGLCVYISMPSAAGGAWSGVAGIHKLIGAQPMKMLEALETERILHLAKRFLTDRGIAVAFQQNAWEGLRSENDPPYSIEKAREGKLRGSLRGMPHARLLGVPPTRLIGPARAVLRQLLSEEGCKLIASRDRPCALNDRRKTT